jgi:hypothetical protein
MKKAPAAIQNNENSTKMTKKLGGCTGKGFKPGKDWKGNPGGRPKEKQVREFLQEVFDEIVADPELRAQARKTYRKMLFSGKVVGCMAWRELADRLDGKVMTPVQHSGSLDVNVITLRLQAARARALGVEILPSLEPQKLLEADVMTVIEEASAKPLLDGSDNEYDSLAAGLR